MKNLHNISTNNIPIEVLFWCYKHQHYKYKYEDGHLYLLDNYTKTWAKKRDIYFVKEYFELRKNDVYIERLKHTIPINLEVV